MVVSNIEVGDKRAGRAFRAWGSGGDGIIISLAYAAGRPRDDGTSVHLATTKSLKIHARLTAPIHCFIVPLTCMLTVFITSNHIPLHVHAIFCYLFLFFQYMYIVYIWSEA